MINWHLDFFRDFSEICMAMRVDPAVASKSDWNQYVDRFAEWKKATAHPELVSNIYLLDSDKAVDSRTLRLDPAKRRFELVASPQNFVELRQELREAPLHSSAPGQTSGAREMDKQAQDRAFTDQLYSGDSLVGWQFESRIPALVQPIPLDRSAGQDSQNTNPGDLNWIVIVLNQNAIRDQILPELAERYFRGTDGLDYQVAVVAGNQPDRVLYSSDPPFGDQEVADADGTMNIFGRLHGKNMASPIQVFHVPSENQGPAASMGITWFPLVRDEAGGQDWRLILRHRRGGALGAFVADSRRRDLAISFGVLFLLVISIAILIITSTRAQRVARLQMDFVTAVSHELRTPLTVISSAAENIAHGVVEGREQLEQYGTVIGGQARKLFEMVEQILLFASIREGHQQYSLRPLEVTDIVEAALSSTAGLIHAAGFHVERNLDSNMPQVLGDLSALSQCLQNLITNALKYGSEQKWMGIRARVTEHGIGGKEIQISVSDHGMGIDSQELPHIFEPFYRSTTVTAAQIHGTGLGLPLAKNIVEAMKGQLSVKSAPGRGSTFTLHLPCLELQVRHIDAKTTEAVSS
jgi:signal transduction histidine kinase